jgi:hypothetical protein
MRHSIALCIDYKGECLLIRKTALWLAWLIMGLVVVTSAAAKPNFSGAWVRDAGSSDAYTAIIVPIIGRNGELPGSNIILRINKATWIRLEYLSPFFGILCSLL